MVVHKTNVFSLGTWYLFSGGGLDKRVDVCPSVSLLPPCRVLSWAPIVDRLGRVLSRTGPIKECNRASHPSTAGRQGGRVAVWTAPANNLAHLSDHFPWDLYSTSILF